MRNSECGMRNEGQKDLFAATACAQCGKKAGKLLKYRDKDVCSWCWYKLRFPKEYEKSVEKGRIKK